MGDTLSVEILETEDDVGVDLGGLVFFEFLVFDDEIEKVTTFPELHDQIQSLCCLYNFVELNDVWVSHQFHYFDFPADSFDVCFFENQVLLQDFDGHRLIGEAMRTQFYLSEVSLPQRPHENVVLQFFVRRFLLVVRHLSTSILLSRHSK